MFSASPSYNEPLTSGRTRNAAPISADEFASAKDSGVSYLRNVFPLIELGWDGTRCAEYLADRGLGKTVKSACHGLPISRQPGWRWIRDHDPDGWTDAVAFDKKIRDGYRLHAFGSKVLGLARFADTITSSDSAAWSFRGRYLPGCTPSHRSESDCLRFALAWHHRLRAALGIENTAHPHPVGAAHTELSAAA